MLHKFITIVVHTLCPQSLFVIGQIDKQNGVFLCLAIERESLVLIVKGVGCVSLRKIIGILLPLLLFFVLLCMNTAARYFVGLKVFSGASGRARRLALKNVGKKKLFIFLLAHCFALIQPFLGKKTDFW